MTIIIPRGRLTRSGNEAPRWPFTLNKDSPQAQGLVGWWPTPFHAGNMLHDFSGHGHHGTLKNGASFVRTEFGVPALRLGGGGAHVDIGVPLANVLEASDTFTFHMVLRPTDVSADGTLIGNWFPQSSWLWWLDVGGNDGYALITKPDNDRIGETDATATVNQWTRASAVYDPPGNFMGVYTNGTLNDNADPVATAVDDREEPLSIGSEGGNSTNRNLIADILETRIYDRRVPDSIIAQMSDPSARWDLYYELGRRLYSFPAAAAAAAGTDFCYRVIYNVEQ